MSEENKDLMTDAEVCRMLRISHPTLRRQLSQSSEGRSINQIKHFKVGNRRRWSRASVVAFMNEEV